MSTQRIVSRSVAETLKIVGVVLLAVGFSAGLKFAADSVFPPDCKHCQACRTHPSGRTGRVIGEFLPPGRAGR